MQKNEINCFLSNEADSLDAYIEIHAGAGGTESQDWADMLSRMYFKWSDKKEFKSKLLANIKVMRLGSSHLRLKLREITYLDGLKKSREFID